MINSSTSVIINIIIAVLAFLVTAGASLTSIFGADLADKIIAVSGLISGVLASANAVLHSISSSKPGPALHYLGYKEEV